MRYTISVAIILLAILAFMLIMLFSSCEKVIDVRIGQTENKYVVEGVVTNQPGTCMVLVSTTKEMGNDNSFAGISGAIVTITDNSGNSFPLIETGAGVYQPLALTGLPGVIYTLTVQLNGELFTASSTMPQPVPMDSMYITNDNVFGNVRKLVNIRYPDPAAERNNYRFIQYRNGIKERKIFVRNDELMDGNNAFIKLRYLADNDTEIRSGDVVQVDMLCIDAATYKYWYSLDQSATGNNQSAAPANPVSNMQGGALGYFSAHTLERKTLTAP